MSDGSRARQASQRGQMSRHHSSGGGGFHGGGGTLASMVAVGAVVAGAGARELPQKIVC